jgi:hypothetical protein
MILRLVWTGGNPAERTCEWSERTTNVRAYKIRAYINGRSKKNGNEYKNYSLTVPFEIAEALPDEMTFVPRMTDDGLLYEPVQQSKAKVELPEWAKNGRNGNSTSVKVKT